MRLLRSSSRWTVLLAVVAVCAMLAGKAARADEQPDKALARKMVFEVQVQYLGRPVAKFVQPGFLVETGGIGVTSFNALFGANGATASFAGDDQTYDVEVLSAEPSLDLALIRLSVKDKDATKAMTDFLKLAPGDLRDGQPVWTLKSSVAFDETKAMPGIVKVSSQNINRDGGMAFDAPGWIGGNVFQDRQTSGCPLVDERGRLAGVLVWTWPGSAWRPAGITAKAVDDLLAAYHEKVEKAADKKTGDKGDGKSDSTVAIRVADVRSKFSDKKLIGSVFPQVKWNAADKDRADRAKTEAKLLADNVKCKLCKGQGSITTQVRTGTVGNGAKHDPTATYGNKTKKCEACKGSKVLAKEAFQGVTERAAEAIASMSPGTDEFDGVLENLTDGAAKCGAMSGFVERLTDNARKSLDPKRMHRGDAVMFIGHISRDPKLSEWDKDMAVIVPNWDAKATILAVAPDDGGKLNKGQSALCVGVVIGMVTTGRDHNCIVLDHVMAVPINAKHGND